MIYSVWKPETGAYDYYEVPSSPKDAFPPAPRLYKSSVGVSPEQAAWKLPMGARKVGSGNRAKGMIALSGSLLDSIEGTVGIPSFILLAGAVFIGWKLLRRA